jgi:hypothetical protein
MLDSAVLAAASHAAGPVAGHSTAKVEFAIFLAPEPTRTAALATEANLGY